MVMYSYSAVSAVRPDNLLPTPLTSNCLNVALKRTPAMQKKGKGNENMTPLGVLHREASGDLPCTLLQS